MVAGSSALAREVRSSTVASVTPAPPLRRASTAPFSICQTCARAGSEWRTVSTASACASLSTITATAPESPRIHCTCSAELVSYTGTVTAPALQIAKSSCTHS